MKRYIILFFVVSIGLLYMACPLLAAQIEELKICNEDALKKDYLELNKVDLISGKIEIKGKITPAQDIEKTTVSLDAGKEWRDADGISPFKFSFIPEEGKEYTVIIKALGKDKKAAVNKVVVIKYFSENLKEVFDDIFERIRVLYIGERLYDLLPFFDSQQYPNFTTFKNNLDETFNQNSNFNFYISVKQVNLKPQENLAIIKVDWDKTYENNLSQSGRNNEIHFKKIGGEWKIVFIKDDTIFIVGTATLRLKA